MATSCAPGPRRTVARVEFAIAERVHFWNTRRLGPLCGNVPPAKFEAVYQSRLQAASEGA